MRYKIRVTITEKTVSDYSYTVEANSGNELAVIIQEILEGSIGGYVADDVEDIESYIDNVELNYVERIDGVDTTKNKPKLITTEDFYCKDYEEEKKNYFLITMNFCSGDENGTREEINESEAKVIDQISAYFSNDNNPINKPKGGDV